MEVRTAKTSRISPNFPMYFGLQCFLFILHARDDTSTHRMGTVAAMDILPPLHLSN